jgi:hypothetical protein
MSTLYPTSSRLRWRLPIIVFVAYTAVACITLSTLLAQFTSAVPGGKDTDYYQFLWGYWWIGHALQTGQSPLWTDYTLYPHINNLSIHTLAPIWYPVYTVANPLVGVIGAGNLMVLLGYSLSGTLMFVWLRRRLPVGNPALAVAFFGGLAYAFSPYMMTHASYIQLNLTPLWWFPLILLLWDELAFPRWLPRPVTALLLGLALWGVWLTDLEYLIWLALVGWGYLLWTLWAARRNLRPVILWGLVAAALMGVLAWIYPLSALVQVNLNPLEFPPAGLETLRHYALPLAALVGLAPNEEVRTMGHVLVWLMWAGILLAWLRWRKRDFPALSFPANQPGAAVWLGLGLVPLILALGPDITIGSTTIPLPYMLLHNALHGQHRVPSRLTGPAAFLLLTFLALAFYPWLARWWSQRKILVMGGMTLLGAAVLFDVGALAAFPTKTIPDYPIYHQIAAEKGDFVVMDVPVGTQYGWTGIGNGYFSMFYGAIHQHKMVNGWLARIPYSTLDYYIKSPLFSWLAGVHDLNADERASAADELEQDRQKWPIGYIIAYRDWIATDQQSDWLGWLNQQPGFCPPEESPDTTLIWWRAEPLGCDSMLTEQVDLGSTWTAIGSGWYNPESVGGPVARWSAQNSTLRVTLKPEASYEVTFSALAFGDHQTVTMSGLSSPINLDGSDWHSYTVTLPPGAASDGLLRLHHDHADSPASRGLSTDERPLAAAYSQFAFKEIPAS